MTTLRRHFLVVLQTALLAACAAPSPPGIPDHEARPETQTETTEQASAPAEPAVILPRKVGMNEQGEVSSISLEDFFLLHQSGRAFVIDARHSYFYHAGHIPSAINVPKTDCDTRIQKLDASLRDAAASGKTIVVYCTSRTCADARTVATHLSQFGHDASVFSAGWKAWQNADMPTE